MSLKNQFILRNLRRKLKELKRQIRPIHLSQVKTAGIIWKVDDREVFKTLTSRLKANGIKISSLCFADQPGSVQGELIFSPADFTFWGELQNDALAVFIEKELDLLIDISLTEGAEFRYVRALSNARFKAGWSDSLPDYFDLSINIGNKKEPGYLAEQLIHYLGEINKPPENQEKLWNAGQKQKQVTDQLKFTI